MKRRQFLQSIGATFAVAGLPVQAPVAVKSAVRPMAYGMSPYAWAKYTARINRKLSPQMLRNFLGLSEGETTEMLARLTRENIVAAPNEAGIYQTTTDYLEHYARKRARTKAMLKTLTKKSELQSLSAEPNVPDLTSSITNCGCEDETGIEAHGEADQEPEKRQK